MIDYLNRHYEVFYVPERKNKFVRLYNKETIISYKLKGYTPDTAYVLNLSQYEKFI
jgi:hypothetical protein